MDFQNRVGGKTGTFGVASAQSEAVDRRERLRKLALESFDLSKDPYYTKNHVGQVECKLCLTVHPNEGNYLSHTQGKKHQENLGKRAKMEEKEREKRGEEKRPEGMAGPLPSGPGRTIKIGRPAYRVVRQRDAVTGQRSLFFEIEYPEIEEGLQPRHRFMSAFEQKVETADKDWQYLLFAAAPYNTIAFKMPSDEIDKDASKFFTHWDKDRKVFTLQLHFKNKT